MPATRATGQTVRADKLSFFPIFVKVKDRFAIVAGNGPEALAKARLLAESRIAIRLLAPEPTRELGVFAIQADANLVAGPFNPSMLDGAALVFAATGDAAQDEAIVAAARERDIPVNAVDLPELCDFYVPALVNRAPVAIAIGSEGSGPVLTQMLRARIEALLPQSVGHLAGLAARYRRTVGRLVPKGAARRRFWRAFFEGNVARHIETGDMAGARRAVTQLLKAPEGATGFVSLVGAGPGEPDLLTLRAQRSLLEADIILHAPAVCARVVALGRRDASRVAIDPDTVAARLVGEANAGRRVVLLTPGDPATQHPTGELVAMLRGAGIGFEIVPGVAASSRAAAAETLAA